MKKVQVILCIALFWGMVLTNQSSAENVSPERELHDDAEHRFHADYLSLATGRLNKGRNHTRRAWPFEVLSIGHTMSSYQNYGGSPYFHHGLDIRGDAGLDVLASAGGKVVNIENYVPGNSAYWEVAILDENGFLWQYHHIDRNSIPEGIWQAYRNNTAISDGTKIGEIFYWSVVTYGERYHHVHLNILDADGKYLNPFAFLVELEDHQAPVIEEVGLLKNGRRVEGRTISGRYSLYAKIHDLILHDQFVVPPYEVSYSIDGAEPVTVWRFDDLPGGASNEIFVENFFNPSMTCGNYRCRKLVVDLGFEKSGPRVFTNAVGSHTVEIFTKDFVGNITSATFDWTVQ